MTSGGVTSVHPRYSDFMEDWQQMRDTYRGQRHVKQARMKYLPATTGQLQDGALKQNSDGYRDYSAYLMRADFPDIVSEAVDSLLGVMHHKDPEIILPPSMESLLNQATLRGESLQLLLRRINREQLVSGRVGLLAEPIDNAPITQPPLLALYQAETIRNWDAGKRDGLEQEVLNLVVLDESEDERTDIFAWERVDKYRVLILGDPLENQPEGTGEYRVAVVRGNGEPQTTVFVESNLTTPTVGGRDLQFIPFTFINAVDIVPDPDDPPLIGLSNSALSIYRKSADYHQSLFAQGQDTLVIKGGQPNQNYRTGAGAVINLPAGPDVDAKYVGVDSSGLSEMRIAIENSKREAQMRGGHLLDSVSRERESGEALRTRVAARTASLTQIAFAGAFGLQNSLRHIAIWMGEDPNEVIVNPNLDFTGELLDGRITLDWMNAKHLGLPLSMQSIHGRLREYDMTKLSFEDELAQIASEDALPGMEDDLDPGTQDPEEIQ